MPDRGRLVAYSVAKSASIAHGDLLMNSFMLLL